MEGITKTKHGRKPYLGSKGKRVLITMPEVVFEKGTNIAQSQTRTFSNYLTTLVQRDIELNQLTTLQA